MISIPKLSESAWPKNAFRADVLTPVGTKPGAPAKLSLGWNEKGLLVRVAAADDTPVEGPSEELWTGDSVEVFVASPADSKDHLQLIFSPGRSPETGGPRVFTIDKRSQKPSGSSKPEIKVEKTEKSYVMDLLIPWDNFAKPPGKGDAITLQIHVNDGVAAGKSARRIWFPKEGVFRDSKLAYRVRLATEASPAQQAIASLEVGRKEEILLSVMGTPEAVNKTVQIEVDGTRHNAGKMEAGGLDGARLTFALPAELAAKKGGTMRVFIGRETLPDALAIPDVAAAREKLLARTPIAARSPVFHAKSFPAIDFVDRELADLAFGPYELKIRYFDAEGNEVTKPEKPGRYGALVTIQTEKGLGDVRRITLFKTASPYVERLNPMGVDLKFPEAFGLPPEIAEKESSLIQRFANGAMSNPFSNTAVLVAALHEIAADPERNHGFDAWVLDSEWWRMVNEKLGLAKPYQYKVYLPKGYDDNAEKAWPLLLCLHGSGERGDDLSAVEVNGPPRNIKQGQDLPFIVVAPQCPLREWWSAELLIDILDEVGAKYRVDPNRVYLTGLSMGGYGTWMLGGRHPERFAAIAPVCGGALPELAPRLANLPAWVFHGDKDAIVPLSESQLIVEALQRLNAPVKLTVYPGVTHDSWTQTYDNPELYKWLLEQVRPVGP